MEVVLKGNRSASVASADRSRNSTPAAEQLDQQRFKEGTSSSVRRPSPTVRERIPVINLTNLDANGGGRQVNSPRSLAVCEEFGIHPTELLPRSIAQFKARGVPVNIAQMRFDHFETRRQEKLAMLREERENRIRGNSANQHQASATAGATSIVSESPAPNTQVSLLPKYTQEVLAKVRGEKHVVETPTRRNVAVSPVRSATGSSIPSAAREERSRAVIERENRRHLVYERAQKLKEERQCKSLMEQVHSQRRSEAHLKSVYDHRRHEIELRRLHRDDVITQIKHKKRQEEYQQTKHYVASHSARSASAQPRDRFQVQLAKTLYLTPRQRHERARSSSAPRSATPA